MTEFQRDLNNFVSMRDPMDILLIALCTICVLSSGVSTNQSNAKLFFRTCACRLSAMTKTHPTHM